MVWFDFGLLIPCWSSAHLLVRGTSDNWAALSDRFNWEVRLGMVTSMMNFVGLKSCFEPVHKFSSEMLKSR